MKFLTILILTLPLTTLAQYTPLVDLPYVSGNNDVGSYVNGIYLLAISIAAFLAVVKIVFGGVKYMLSDVVTDKGQAKKDIRGALLGLLIVLAAVLILNTINPSLTNLNVLRNANRYDFNSSGSINLWGGGVPSSTITSSDGTVIGNRTSINNDDPNRDQKIADAVNSCRAAGNSSSVKNFNGYTSVDCHFDNLGSGSSNADLTFSNGSVSATSNYNPNATQLSIDCVTVSNTSCMNYCTNRGGAIPDRNNPALCVISTPQNVNNIHCSIDSNSPSCTNGSSNTNNYRCANGQIVSASNPSDLRACGDDVIFNIDGEWYPVNTNSTFNFSCNYRTVAQVDGCQTFCTTNGGTVNNTTKQCSGANNPEG